MKSLSQEKNQKHKENDKNNSKNINISLREKVKILNDLCQKRLSDPLNPIFWSIKTILMDLEMRTNMFLFAANIIEKDDAVFLDSGDLESYQSFTHYRLLEDMVGVIYKIIEAKKNLFEKVQKYNLDQKCKPQYDALNELFSIDELKFLKILRDHFNHLFINNTGEATKLYDKIIELSLNEEWIDIYNTNFEKENLDNIKSSKDFFIEKSTSLANKSIKYSVIFNPFNTNSISENLVGFQLASKLIVVNINILNGKVLNIVFKCLTDENMSIFNFFWFLFQANSLF